MKVRSSSWLAILCSCLAAIPSLMGQVVINELMSSNRATTADEDGHYEDWIELKNTGSSTVDLEGYGLTDDPSQSFKWIFPKHLLAPGELLVVWASGKDRKGHTPEVGLLREVYFDVIGGSVEFLEASGNYPDFPDLVEVLDGHFDAPRDLADRYGQRISGYLSPSISGTYEFSISADNGSRLFLSSTEDPARAQPIAEIPADRWSNPDSYNEYSTQTSGRFELEAGQRYYMAAVMKEDWGGDHLSVRWRRIGDFASTEVIPASNFIVKPSVLHTNFKLGAEGEPLRLTRPDGGLEDLTPPVALPVDISFGRPASAPATLAYFEQSTRGAENDRPAAIEILQAVPSFSKGGGFYQSNFMLALENPEPGTALIYTLDGSIPDPDNIGGKTYRYKDSYPGGELLDGSYETLAYHSAIEIRDRSNQSNDLSMRTTTFGSSSSYAPSARIFKGTVVRARLVKEGALPGPVVTHSYFITSLGDNRFNVPVISLSMNEDDLFGYSRGLYTAGEDYDHWRATSSFSGDGGTPANYKRRGPHAEHPAHFELFVPQQGQVVSRNLAFRIHGGWSRAWPQKSLRLYADRGSDGSGPVEYPLIPGLVGRRTGQPVDAFNRFVLRNSGNDHEATRLRDAFIHAVMAPLDLDQQGYQPAVHFINGEYWGLINIRERIDRYYIASHHGVDPDKVAILSNNAEVSEGTRVDRDDFLELRDFVASNFILSSENRDYVTERMDLDNFIRYNVAQIYANNRDWPHNNIDVWRVSHPEGLSGVTGTGDGRWRWILFDTDFGFGLNGGANVDTLAHATRNAGADDWSTGMLRSLLWIPEFRNDFINTFADHMATSFKPQRISALADSMHAQISGSFPEHSSRWRNQGNPSVDSLKSFGSNRPAYMRNHLTNRFGLTGSADLTLDTPHPDRGRIGINSIIIDADTPGLSDPAQPYPWTGSYFKGVPVQVTALPAAGYRFAGWLELPGEMTPTVTVFPGEEAKLTALFDEAPTTHLVHYWNFNESGSLLDATIGRVAGSALEIDPAPLTEIISGTGQEFSGVNARVEDEAGAHLRLNNPLGASLNLSLPTMGFEQIVFQYEARRSGQGAGVQKVSYSFDGADFTHLESIAVTETPALHKFDFSHLPEANDNPQFMIRIEFSEGLGGNSGNNRIDNITVDAWAIPGANQPPTVLSVVHPLAAIEEGEGTALDLATWFEDPEGDVMTFSASVADGSVGSVAVEGSLLTFAGMKRGETTITLTANDGIAPAVSLTVPLLVYPSAHLLADSDFAFNAWSARESEGAFPNNMLFLQSEVDDPGVGELLNRAYGVGNDYHEDDVVGFPYGNKQWTRINGLDEAGISFVNTGSSRDLGGSLLAIDTRGLDEAQVHFVTETLDPGEREYAMRLQYRVGTVGDFADIYQNDEPLVYYADTEAAGVRQFSSIPLPAAAIDQPYVQLLWRYHHVSGNLGSRPEIRLDDIVLTSGPPAVTGFVLWQQQQFPDPADQADPTVSGADADPFGWNVSNLMRYALAIDGVDDVASRMPRLERQPGTGSVLFRFPLDSEIEGIAFQVEASSDLASWDEILYDTRLPSDHEVKEGWLDLEVREPDAGDELPVFFRLRVILLDP